MAKQITTPEQLDTDLRTFSQADRDNLSFRLVGGRLARAVVGPTGDSLTVSSEALLSEQILLLRAMVIGLSILTETDLLEAALSEE